MRKKLTTTLAATLASMYKCYHASRATHWMLSMIVLVMLATAPSSVQGDIAKGVFAASSGEETVAVRKVSAVANVASCAFIDEVAAFEKDVESHFNSVMLSDSWDEVSVIAANS